MNHISVCVCTYKRPDLLRRLLAELCRQETLEQFSYDVVIVDNDVAETAKLVVGEFQATSNVPIMYCVQPQQNIALARNTALRHARGSFVAFFDDDQFPTRDWLLTLYRACQEYGVAGVLGPVKPHFDVEPPAWVLKGHFCERPTYATGFVIDWRKGRTGNVLLKRDIFNGLDEAFRPEFLTGEDQDFFRRMIETGHTFIWCNEAVAYEITPQVRWDLGFMLRRALLRGQVSIRHPGGKASALRSLVAVPLYSVALPFLLLIGYHWFVKYLVKLFDHTGRLLALAGFHPVREHYVTG